jgi:hypothetical protein
MEDILIVADRVIIIEDMMERSTTLMVMEIFEFITTKSLLEANSLSL